MLSTKLGELEFPKDGWQEAATSEMQRRGVPFRPLEINREFTVAGEEMVNVWFGCPKVTPEGRCSIYQDRPETCKAFTPGASSLCVFALLKEGRNADSNLAGFPAVQPVGVSAV